MRSWYKYSLDQSFKGRVFTPRERTYSEHAKTMGGYCSDSSYASKQDFLNKYFFNYHLSRLERYCEFIQKHLDREKEVLSVASGRCALELYLTDRGYRITCSDQEILAAHEQTKALFPEFKYIKYDVLSHPAGQKYDTILALSLIYIFDEKELERFFGNVSASLEEGGSLILDSAGSPDNFLSYIIHDVVLKYETLLRRSVKFIKQKSLPGLCIKHAGYRRSDYELIEIARRHGLELAAQENYAFLTEFLRSWFFTLMIRHSRLSKKILCAIGKNVPYIRMFNFRKVSR